MIILSIALANFLIFVSCQNVVVNLPNGTVSGYQSISVGGKPVYTFWKIPYAAPPVGNLRFQAPQPAKSWTGTRDGTSLDAICYQTGQTSPQENEDCLFLNVFTDQNPSSISTLKPVWVFFHGGAFAAGSGGVDVRFILDYDVVFVSISYRLGPFGFLSTGDEVIPGNAGLKDQQLAIRYIKENIKLFGGDPDKIVIGGQSAGASSVSYQLLNPANEGLFRGVIQESGTFLNPWSLQKEAPDIARKTAAKIDPSYAQVNDTTKLASFLRSVTGAQLKAAADQVWNDGGTVSEGFTYAPVIEVPHDGAFLTEKMYQRLRTGNFIKVNTLIGFNSEEQIASAGADLTSLKSTAAIYDQYPNILVPIDLGLADDYQAQLAAGQTIRTFYTNSSFADGLGAFIKYLSDSFFIKSIIRQAHLQAKYATVYLYEFSYHGDIGKQPIYVDGADRVCHGEELWYMYSDGTNNDVSAYSQPDRVTHYRMLEMWTNFVKTLNPTSSQSQYVNVVWPPVSSSGDDINFLNINDTLNVQTAPRGNTYKGWVKLYDSFNIEEKLDTW